MLWYYELLHFHVNFKISLSVFTNTHTHIPIHPYPYAYTYCFRAFHSLTSQLFTSSGFGTICFLLINTDSFTPLSRPRLVISIHLSGLTSPRVLYQSPHLNKASVFVSLTPHSSLMEHHSKCRPVIGLDRSYASIPTYRI